ncbi:MAG: tRNA uridine-5-carboxymethylaminomethyl(34) synthesis GTPase MnmE [Pelagibacterales bacterium]|nr:tRNA uridine-5-carboxymethylaminomethyl(34) synthesis GTPase MnmE [Pelagibacterales bacterium]
MTIYALSTANGVSGLAVIRISGHLALTALKTLSRKSNFETHKMKHIKIYDPDDGMHIDTGLGVYFAKPKSFTGEDVTELHIHGGISTINLVLNALGKIDQLRLAEPGEFTKRAFVNDKMDLTAIEAMGDLINAHTEVQHKLALSQVSGSLNKLYLSWRKKLIEIIAYLEAGIDFADEDIPADVLKNIMKKIDELISDISLHISEKNQGEIIKDGFRIAIIGEPNVGKSSLINLLAKRDVAIVSEEAGTTRDAIEVTLNISGYPVIFTDTAGIREASNTIEKKGIDITHKKIADSHLVVELFDDIRKINQKKGRVSVLNKIDLINENEVTNLETLKISTKTNQGIDELINAISSHIDKDLSNISETIPTRTRYILGSQKIIQSLSSAKNIDPINQTELFVEELRLAVNEIGRLTGLVDVEEYLEVIFKDFCIGK